MCKRQVLLLNASEEVLRIIDWKKAVKLIVSGRAKRPFGYDKTYQIETTSGTFVLPAAIMLVEYIRIPNDDFQPTRTNILRRDNWTCQYCGKKSRDKKLMTIDHVKPKSKGGDSGWTNLVCACIKCNQRKANMSLKKSGMKLKRSPKKPNVYAMKLVGLDHQGKELWSRWIGYHMES